MSDKYVVIKSKYFESDEKYSLSHAEGEQFFFNSPEEAKDCAVEVNAPDPHNTRA